MSSGVFNVLLGWLARLHNYLFNEEWLSIILLYPAIRGVFV